MKTYTRSTSIFSTSLLALVLLIGLGACNKSNETDGASSKTEAPRMSIQEAAFFGNANAVKGHIQAKSDLNEKDAYGSTPLHIAATFDKTQVAILLINGGADINATGGDGSTPLHTAAFFGRVEIVKALLAKNPDTSARNNYNSTALESVSAPFEAIKPFYDQMSKDLGPLGLKLNYEELKANRVTIAELITNASK